MVMVTTSDRQEAFRITCHLLNEKLIACANIVGPTHSLFWWEGKIDEAKEFLIFMKSQKALFKRLSERIREIHSYKVPEIISLPITEGSQHYLDWVSASLQPVNKNVKVHDTC